MLEEVHSNLRKMEPQASSSGSGGGGDEGSNRNHRSTNTNNNNAFLSPAPRRGRGVSLEETAMKAIYEFYQNVKERINYLNAQELQEATLLLGNLASTSPPNMRSDWRDNVVGMLTFVAGAHDEFFQKGGVCALWPRGLRGGQTPTKPKDCTFTSSETPKSSPIKSEAPAQRRRASSSSAIVPSRALAHNLHRERRPPLPPPQDARPVWKLTNGSKALVLNQLPSPDYEELHAEDPKIANVPELSEAPGASAVPQVDAKYVPRLNAIIKSRSVVDASTGQAQTHLDAALNGVDLSLLYVQLLSRALIEEGSKSSRILISVHRDALPAWFSAIRASMPTFKLIVLANEVDFIQSYNLLDYNSSHDLALPLLYICADDYVYQPSDGVFDTLIVDDAERYCSHSTWKNKSPSAFHTIVLCEDPQNVNNYLSSFDSVWLPDESSVTSRNAIGGTLRSTIAFIDLIAEAEEFMSRSVSVGVDPRIKLSHLHDIVYSSNGDAVCTLFSATAAIALHVLATRPQSRILIVCKNTLSTDILATAFEAHVQQMYGAGAVLLLNGAAAGTNFHAIENVSASCRLIITRTSIAARQCPNLWKAVDTVLFVETPFSRRVLENVFNSHQTKDCLAIAIEAANAYGLYQVDRALADYGIDPKAKIDWKATYNGPKIKLQSITESEQHLFERGPPRTFPEASVDFWVKADTTTSSAAVSSQASSTQVEHSRATAPESHPVAPEKLASFQPNLGGNYRAYCVSLKDRMAKEQQRRLERIQNRKKRPAPSELAASAAKRMKRSLSICAERFRETHMDTFDLHSQRLQRAVDDETRKMIVLITVDTDIIPSEHQKSSAMSVWLVGVLSELNLDADYNVLDTSTGEQRGNKRTLVFAVLLVPRKPGLTREAWLKNANIPLHSLSDSQLVQLTQLFDIEIDDEESDISVEFMSSFGDDDDEVWEDVEFTADDASRSVATNASMRSNNRSGGGNRSRRVSPSRRPRARRTSFNDDDDDMGDVFLDDISDDGDPAPAKSVSSSSRGPSSAAPSSSAASSNLSQSQASSSGASAAAAPAASVIPPPSASSSSSSSSAPTIRLMDYLRTASSASVDIWLKIVSLLKKMRFDIPISDIGEITAAAVELDLNLGLQLAEVLGSSASAPETPQIATALAEIFGDKLTLWVEFLRFLKSQSVHIHDEQARLIVNAVLSRLKTAEDRAILAEVASLLQSLKESK